MNLFDFIEKTSKNYENLGIEKSAFDMITKTQFVDLINDDDKCTKFLISVMNIYFTGLKTEDRYLIPNKERASHGIVTWLLGLGINEKLHIYKKDYCTNFLWTNTAVLHDYGLLSKRISNIDLRIDEITKPYNLLTDNYSDENLKILNNNCKRRNCYYTYSYDEIKNYFEYSKEYHKKDKIEKCDHGIVGACLIFNNYCKGIKLEEEQYRVKPSLLYTEMQKISCINIASHNIFKSDSLSLDSIYKDFHLNNLLFNSKIRITENNGLLMLLCLVDTIDCTKRFARRKGKKGGFIYRSTLLKNIDIEFTNNKGVIIDFNNLLKYIKLKTNYKNRHDMIKTLSKHCKEIKKITTWTSFKTSTIGNKYRILVYL